MPVADALPILENIPQVRQKLQTLVDVGLGYLTLDRSTRSLSGGEVQRVVFELVQQAHRVVIDAVKEVGGPSFFANDFPATAASCVSGSTFRSTWQPTPQNGHSESTFLSA